ncbi:MAG TPA: hypothetical protein VG722_06750 [Tepidisphaeraceae bacterium]|nr:hypothetical protein [Tepidisphaeraceae bacterium]
MHQVNARAVRKCWTWLTVCAVALAVMSAGQRAWGDTLFDNFFNTGPNGNPSYDQEATQAKWSNSYSLYYDVGEQFAAAFTSPINATVSDIILPLDVYTYGNYQPIYYSATIVLYADNNNAPGAVLFSTLVNGLNAGSYSPGNPNISGVSVTGVTVDAGAQYWVSVNLSNVNSPYGYVSARWYVSNTDMNQYTVDDPGLSKLDVTNAQLGYNTWVAQQITPRPAFFVAGVPITTVAVPLPASVLGGAGLLATLATGSAVRKRRSRQTTSR